MIETQRRAAQAAEIHYQDLEAQVYDLEYGWKKDDLEFWKGLALEYAGREGHALELACGTLRVLLPVAKAGVRVTGLDQSPWMLSLARAKLAAAAPEVQGRVNLVEGDFRAYDLGTRFNLVYIPFNTFLFAHTIQDQLATLETARRHLAPGGVFALNVFVPDINRLAQILPGAQPWGLELDQEQPEKGVRFQRDSYREVDPRRQLLKVHFRMREYRERVLAREWLSDLTLTYLFPRELEHLAARAGYDIVHYWGDYDRSDFWTMDAPGNQILVLRPT